MDNFPSEASKSRPTKPIGSYHAAIAAGAYTDILYISGPSEALYGDPIILYVTIKNLCNYGIWIAAGISGVADVNIYPVYASVNPGASQLYEVTFIMPNKKLILDVYSQYWSDPIWYLDDHDTVTINLQSVGAAQFQSLVCSYIRR